MSAAATTPRRPRDSRQRTLVTAEGLTLPLTLASRGARLGALVLDLIFLFLLMLTAALLINFMGLGVVLAGSEGEGDQAGALEFLQVLSIVALFLFHYAWFLYFELSPRAATPGKRIVGIRVAARPDSSGFAGRLTAEMVLARNLLRDIELLLPVVFLTSASLGGDMSMAGIAAAGWFLIFALLPFFNRDRLRAGDMIAGTWVVEAPKRKLEAPIARAAAAEGPAYSFGATDLAVYGEYELQTLERVLRDRRPEAMAAVAAAICRKIGWTPPATGGEQAFLEAYYTQLRARLEAGMRFGRRKADKHAG